MHIVEQLIHERTPKLMARPRLFRALKPLLYRILAYDAAVFLADNIKDKTGHEAFSLFQAIRDKRPDHVFLANADALRVMPKASDLIIPVEWVMDKRSLAKTKQTLVDVKTALDAGQCVVIFPSGRLARWGWRGLYDQEWQSSAAMLAKKYAAPVIPLNIKARNSWLYYLFSRLNAELRDITLFHELLNKKGQTFHMTFGEPIAPEALPKKSEAATAYIRKIVESL